MAELVAVVAAVNGRRHPGASIARGGVLNLAGAAFSAAANVLLVMLITQRVEPARAGSLFTAMSVFLICETAARLGSATGMVYWLARLRALGSMGQLRQCLRTGLIPVLVAGLVVGAVVIGAAHPLGRLIDTGTGDAFASYLSQLGLFLVLASLGAALLASTRGLGTMRATVALDRVARPAAQLLLTALVLLVDKPQLLALAWAAPYLLTASGGAWWLRRLTSRTPLSSSPTLAELATSAEPSAQRGFGAVAYWRFTGPRAVNALIQLALQRLDIIIVAALRGPAEAAVYTAATRFLVVGQMANQSISLAAQPQVSALMSVGDVASAKRVYRIATAWLVLATWPLYLTSIVLREEFLGAFGHGYQVAGSVVEVLALTMLGATACGMVDTMLNMAGKTSWTLFNSATALTTLVLVDLALVPPFGVLGAAIGWAAAIAVNNVVPLTQLHWSMGLNPWGEATVRAMVLVGLPFGTLATATVFLDLSAALRVSLLLGAAVVCTLTAVRWREQLQLAAFPLRPRRGRTDVTRTASPMPESSRP